MTRTPDIVTIGGSVRLVSVPLIAREFGASVSVIQRTLEAMGVPVLTIADREWVQLAELEHAILARTVGPRITNIDAHMEWLSKYVGNARRQAVLESLRADQPAWSVLRKRVQKRGYRVL